MAYIYYNANPLNKRAGDCVIRAISKAMNMSWDDVAIDLSMMMVTEKDIVSSNGTYNASSDNLSGYSSVIVRV